MPLYVEMSGDQPVRFFFSETPPSPKSNSRIEMLGEETPTLPTPVYSTTPQPDDAVAIVVTCHDKYLKWLPQCLDSIDNQSVPFSSKILVLDGTDLPADIQVTGWETITGKWGTPNPARNAGLHACVEPWVVFFDADNIMPQGYSEGISKNIADRKVAFIYPDLRICDQEMRPIRFKKTPLWDPEELQRGNFVDTSSVWRREALISVGGWGVNQPTEDDYYLAMRMMHKGWMGKKGEDLPAVFYREHPEELSRWGQAWKDGKENFAVWLIREMLLIVPVWENAPTLEWLCSQDLPERGRIVLLSGEGIKTDIFEKVSVSHPQMTVEIKKRDPSSLRDLMESATEDIVYVVGEGISAGNVSQSVLSDINAVMPPSHAPGPKNPGKNMDGDRYVGGAKFSRGGTICIFGIQGWVARSMAKNGFLDLETGVREKCSRLGISFVEMK